MHPFYEPNNKMLEQERTQWIGLLSMAVYIVFWGVISVIATRIIKRFMTAYKTSGEKEDTAIDILRRRYAGGEIDEETYLKIKNNLE